MSQLPFQLPLSPLKYPLNYYCFTHILTHTHTLLREFSISPMCICLGMTIWGWITYLGLTSKGN